jgi:hypothetical protein
MHSITSLRENGPMEHVRTEKTEKKDAHRIMKRPYAKPTLIVHGDVEEITNALRKAGVKSNKGSIFDFE